MKHTSTDLVATALALDPQAALARALARGGRYADLFVEETRRTLVRIEGGEVRRVGRDHDRGLALRLLDPSLGTRLLSTTQLSAQALAGLAEDLGRGLSGEAVRPAPLSSLSTVEAPPLFAPEDLSLERRLELAWIAERAARAVSSAVKEVSVRLHDSRREIYVAGSDGRQRATCATRVVLAVEVIAAEGDRTQSAYEAAGGCGGYELADETVAERTGRWAAERAVRMLHAAPAPTGPMPVILAAEAGGTFVHEAVGHALEADTVLEEMSVLGGREGERVASPLISVVDDPTLPGLHGSMSLDDEGCPTRAVELIREGMLVDLLADQRSAWRLGRHATGHARRESFRARPIVRMTNTLIRPGRDSPEQILTDTPRGLYVVRMGGGEVDTLTGQFLFEVAEAYGIERGRLGGPVRGATLAGDLLEVLERVDRVGSDLGFGLGFCGKEAQEVPVADGEPTLRVPSLVVGGGA